MMGPGIAMLTGLGDGILFLVRMRDFRTVSLSDSWEYQFCHDLQLEAGAEG
jgi:hypothetical protein